jgi:hypothetical protein
MNEETTSAAPEKLQQVRNLYFNTTLTQSEIGALVGLSQKTVSCYISENNWRSVRDRVRKMPILLIEQMNSELKEISDAVAARPKGKRFPTPREAETRRKIIYSIAAMKERQSAATHLEVLLNFLQNVSEYAPDDARIISNHIQEYIHEAPEIVGKDNPKPYKLNDTNPNS